MTFVVYTWLVVNWGPFIRLDDLLDRNWHVQPLWPVLSKVDRIGQRAVCLPMLAAVVVATVWRHRSWRPALPAAIATFAVNLLVLIAKVAMSRGRPLSGRGFFSGGDMYPSGHAANIMVVYGLSFYLIAQYGRVSERTNRILLRSLCVFSVVMFTTSLTLRWHWFSDLVAGFLVGGFVLALTVGIDAALPFRSDRLVVLPAAVESVQPVQPGPTQAQPVEPEPAEAEPVEPEPAEPVPSSLVHVEPHGAGSGAQEEVRAAVSFRRTPLGSRAGAAGRRFRR